MIWSISASLGEDLLISGWSVVSGGQFVGTSAAVLFVAVAYELLALARPVPKDALRPRAIVRDCGVVALRSFLGYVLMLVVMSMNLWLLVCASLGAALGHGVLLCRKNRQHLPRKPADHAHDSEPFLETETN